MDEKKLSELVKKALAKREQEIGEKKEEVESPSEDEEDSISFLRKKTIYAPPMRNSNVLVKPTKYENIEVRLLKENKDTDNGCMRYYYPKYEDFIEAMDFYDGKMD